MLASRRLLLLAFTLYAILPLPWILWRPEGLFYSFDTAILPIVALAGALFVAGWMTGEAARLRGGWFAGDAGAADQHWPAAQWAVVLGLLCSAAANVALYMMGALVIDESTGRERVPVLTTLGSAHIFSLIYSGCLLFCADKRRRPSRANVALAAASVLATIAVGLIEGRRTAVALPVVVYIALALITNRRRLLRILLWTTPLFFALVAVTTYTRTTLGEDVDVPDSALLIGGDALVGRLGNPLLILDPILDNIRNERHPLDPQTPRSIAADLPNLGLVSAPFETGFGNELGRDLGLLPQDNDFTGINSGWIGELLLYAGLPAVFLGGIVLGFLAASAWQLIAVAHPAGLFLRVMVVIFVTSGFQMEVAFPIASLVRATAIALVLAALERFAAPSSLQTCSST